MKNKILAIIPARGGSKGVPRKNIREVNGKPLIAWTIEAALQSKSIDKLVVSTDDQEIKEISIRYGAEVIDRPDELAVDTALTEPAMTHALEEVEKSGFIPTHIALIQCTSPLLSSDVIKEAVAKTTNENFDSCITVFKPDGYEFKWKRNGDLFIPDHDVEHRPRRQELDLPYHENGAFYITRIGLFKKTKNRFGGNLAKITAILMSEENSLQIDSEFQLWLAGEILKKRTLDK